MILYRPSQPVPPPSQLVFQALVQKALAADVQHSLQQISHLFLSFGADPGWIVHALLAFIQLPIESTFSDA